MTAEGQVVNQGGGGLPSAATESFCEGWCVGFVVLASVMVAGALCVWAKAMRDKARREEGLAEAIV